MVASFGDLWEYVSTIKLANKEARRKLRERRQARLEAKAYQSFDHEAFFRELVAARDVEERYRVIAGHPRLRPLQNVPEIAGLIERLNPIQPRRILEIGTSRGGTTMLLSACFPEARIVTVDLVRRNPLFFRSFGRKRGIRMIRGNSQSIAMRSRVFRAMGWRPIDFVLIDGDHRYDGVKRDFELYGPMVRRGGVVAFHDIVPDYATRYGKPTGAYAGDVPAFWNEVKPTRRREELIESPDQDGRGIGVLYL